MIAAHMGSYTTDEGIVYQGATTKHPIKGHTLWDRILVQTRDDEQVFQLWKWAVDYDCRRPATAVVQMGYTIVRVA